MQFYRTCSRAASAYCRDSCFSETPWHALKQAPTKNQKLAAAKPHSPNTQSKTQLWQFHRAAWCNVCSCLLKSKKCNYSCNLVDVFPSVARPKYVCEEARTSIQLFHVGNIAALQIKWDSRVSCIKCSCISIHFKCYKKTLSVSFSSILRELVSCSAHWKIPKWICKWLALVNFVVLLTKAILLQKSGRRSSAQVHCHSLLWCSSRLKQL